ncbi:hypothetical protein BCT01_24500 [Vibrio tasmaniensis]|nr:hypothetical protein BCT01_24500 [Vibrio tasmaniensis]PMP17688.1 hypothetical protein BCS92_24495 [Vibrio tasmaniensis]
MEKVILNLKYQLQKAFLCSFGKHIDCNGANFCGACGYKVNPNAYHGFVATLYDGTKIQVNAINEMHARSLVIYESCDAIDRDTGEPLSRTKIHPENIKSIALKS